jgi:putative membrane protein
LISSLGIFAATWLVPGIEFSGPGWHIGIVALVFGLLNALLRPLFYLLTCPLVILSLGLFGLVINAILFAASFAIFLALLQSAKRNGSLLAGGE